MQQTYVPNNNNDAVEYILSLAYVGSHSKS